MVGSAVSRAIDRIGRTVVIRNYTNSGTDRPDWSETTGSPYNVKARVDYGSTPQQIADAYSTEADIDVDVWIKEDAISTSEITDGAGQGATEVDVDGETLIVMLKDVQDNDLIRLACVKET
jgi:hypothetical protein